MVNRIDLSKINEKEKGYITGFYVGDGNLFIKKSKGIYRLRYFFWIKEKDIQNNIERILQKISLKTRKYRDKDNTVVIEVHSKKLLQYISKVCNKDGLKKQKASVDFFKGFIEGLIDSDGYVQRNYAEITTSNEKLKNNIVEILKKFNVIPNIRRYSSPISNKSGWRVGFSLNGLKLKPVKWVPTP